MESKAPVLPWGAAATTTVSAQQPGQEPALALDLKSVGLQLGDRIEVKWNLENDDDGTSSVKWWGATVVEQSSSSLVTTAYKIRWDSTEGYDEEDGLVGFTADHALLNLLMTSEEQQQPAAAGAQAAPEANADANADASDEEEEAGSTLMLWRREGDSWDEADSEDEEMAAEGGLISISQYSALCEQAARAEGKSYEEWSMEGFNTLPAGQQRQVADRFCDFRDKLAQFLAQAQQQGELQDGVITLEHVQKFVKRL